MELAVACPGVTASEKVYATFGARLFFWMFLSHSMARGIDDVASFRDSASFRDTRQTSQQLREGGFAWRQTGQGQSSPEEPSAT